METLAVLSILGWSINWHDFGLAVSTKGKHMPPTEPTYRYNPKNMSQFLHWSLPQPYSWQPNLGTTQKVLTSRENEYILSYVYNKFKKRMDY